MISPDKNISTKAVDVMLWGLQIGSISEDPNRPGFYLFQYTSNIPIGVNPSPIHMPVGKEVYNFDLDKKTFQGLPGMVADSLPDKFGNALVEQYMEKQGFDKNKVTTLDRLLYIGKRGMGALEFEPASAQEEVSHHPLAMKDLVESARKAIQGKLSEVASDLIHIGSSAGGARPKAVIGWNRRTENIVAGQFNVPEGYEHWLLKFDGVGEDKELGGSDGYGRIEYVYYLMARDAGIEMNECRLLKDDKRAHFMTKRFDRINNEKVHMQSFCALEHQDFNIPYVTDYSLLLRTAQKLNLGKQDITQIYKRMVFNVLANNCDDHTKNFAFLMDPTGTWLLAPAFDVTHAYNPNGEWTSKHQMLVNGKANIDEITREDLLTIAKKFSISKPTKIIDKVKVALLNWNELASKYDVSDGQKVRISKEIDINIKHFM
ncbi:HIPA PROTEIN [hydrothermal vent metagenome]|uniref:HIPA PROTEIN n=1 Tax=hydrothermal vent metagenome TaxID=652676 RepID=A0A1W1E072_9ZZZZ